MSITKTIQQMVDALASIANEPDRTLQQRPVRFAKAKEAIQAGRVLLESIAKQEQGEPVARIEITYHRGQLESWRFSERPTNAPEGTYDVYTTPQQRKPLTDEQADSIIDGLRTCLHRDSKRDFLKTWLRDSAAHGIKE